jgi:hypothetical protein
MPAAAAGVVAVSATTAQVAAKVAAELDLVQALMQVRLLQAAQVQVVVVQVDQTVLTEQPAQMDQLLR